MKKTNWIYRNSLVNDDFFCTDKHTFIIRVLKNGKYKVYDYRQYSNMATIDFNYFGYSAMSEETTLQNAKKIALKYNQNVIIGKDYGSMGRSKPLFYLEIDQHSQASKSLMRCKMATKEEYTDLEKELNRIGYNNLIIINEG